MPNKFTVTTKTKAQIKADFAKAFKNIEPDAKAKVVSQKDRLEPYREEILRQRQRGLSWEKIAIGMRPPPISETVSAKLLRKVFGGDETMMIPAQPAAPVPRLVLDPATGRPSIITPPAAAPAPAAPPPPPAPKPMTPQERQHFAELLQGLIPPIVKTKMNRRDAHSYAANAVELLRPKEADRFQEVLALELDSLTESTCAQYGVAPELIAPWRRGWK